MKTILIAVTMTCKSQDMNSTDNLLSGSLFQGHFSFEIQIGFKLPWTAQDANWYNSKYLNTRFRNIIITQHVYNYRIMSVVAGKTLSPYTFHCLILSIPGLILGLRPANETLLRCDTNFHWLGANLESALYCIFNNLSYYFLTCLCQAPSE